MIMIYSDINIRCLFLFDFKNDMYVLYVQYQEIIDKSMYFLNFFLQVVFRSFDGLIVELLDSNYMSFQ